MERRHIPSASAMDPPMTMLAPGSAHLADASLRRTLTAALRQRVPARDAEDLVQSVLEGALASARLPSDPAELRRWVVAIARHKIADYHRRAKRFVPTEDGALDPVDTRTPDAADALAARELLDAVAASPGEQRTLGWLVREHEGERLCAIAAEEGLSPAVVRQRVSRLRRALRARYAGMLALLLAGSAALAGIRALVRGDDASRAAIVADASSDEGRALAVLQGSWRVEALALEPASEARLDPAERAVFARATSFEVVVEGTTLRIAPGGEQARRTLSLTSVREGALGLLARAPGRAEARLALAWTEGGGLAVVFDDGRLRGSARLVRAR